MTGQIFVFEKRAEKLPEKWVALLFTLLRFLLLATPIQEHQSVWTMIRPISLHNWKLDRTFRDR